MLRLEVDAVGRVRVIGRLCGEAALRLLRESLSQGAVIVDTAGVLQADEEAVTLLAGLSADEYTIVSPPAWLSRWIDRVREVGDRQEPQSTRS